MVIFDKSESVAKTETEKINDLRNAVSHAPITEKLKMTEPCISQNQFLL
jgi:hypothetical protein